MATMPLRARTGERLESKNIASPITGQECGIAPVLLGFLLRGRWMKYSYAGERLAVIRGVL